MFLEISQNSQENTCARASFLITLQASALQLFKQRLWHRCFPVNFVKFLRTPFLTKHLWRLLLDLPAKLTLPTYPSKIEVTNYAQIVNYYQSLTGVTKTYIPGVTGHVDALLNLIVIKKAYLIANLHVADSLEVNFAKFERAVFRNQIFDL